MMNFNWKFLTPLALVVLVATALVDKIIPSDLIVLRIGALWIVNLAIWVAADRIVHALIQKRPVPVVSHPRPLARPQQTVVEQESGGES